MNDIQNNIHFSKTKENTEIQIYIFYACTHIQYVQRLSIMYKIDFMPKPKKKICTFFILIYCKQQQRKKNEWKLQIEI